MPRNSTKNAVQEFRLWTGLLCHFPWAGSWFTIGLIVKRTQQTSSTYTVTLPSLFPLPWEFSLWGNWKQGGKKKTEQKGRGNKQTGKVNRRKGQDGNGNGNRNVNRNRKRNRNTTFKVQYEERNWMGQVDYVLKRFGITGRRWNLYCSRSTDRQVVE